MVQHCFIEQQFSPGVIVNCSSATSSTILLPTGASTGGAFTSPTVIVAISASLGFLRQTRRCRRIAPSHTEEVYQVAGVSARLVVIPQVVPNVLDAAEHRDNSLRVRRYWGLILRVVE